MKRILPLICLLFTSLMAQTTVQAEKKVITIQYTRQYCGGAKPSAEILEQLNTALPLSNCKVKLVRTDKKSKSRTLMTNDKGEFSAALPNGKYKIYIASNKTNKAQLPFNKKCRKLCSMPLGELDLTANQTTAEIRIPCDPCDPSVKKRQ